MAPVIRPLETHADYEACLALQRLTWGQDFRELVPPAMLMVAQKVGGVTAGAFEGDALVGFVYGLTGVRDGALVHWSHMLAVRPDRRDHGIGRRLKGWQREQVARAGVERMYWTFDPLVARNAHFNLSVLGARVVEHHRNLYGESAASRTDSVIGSDRFVVAWDVRAVAERRGGTVAPSRGSDALVTLDTDALPEAAHVLVAIPSDIQALKEDRPDEARRWRAVTRRAFEHYLPRGYRVAGVAARGPDGLAYVLVRRDG